MKQPRYFPFMHGVYDVKAGITSLGKDFGNGPVDARVFQIDEQFPAYHAAKLESERYPEAHILREGLARGTENVITNWMAQRLAAEYPERCAGLVGAGCTLGQLALRVQEDLAVLEIDDAGANSLSYLHVAMPSGWPPEEKIGRPFDQVHAPVPHIDPISAKQDAIARLMVNATRGALRFAWTITDDAALNHHPKRDRQPQTPPASPLPDHPPGEPLLRVERQVIWGFPDCRASLFLIRTYLYPFDDLPVPVRRALGSAVAGMSDASLRYKNMDRGVILDRLARG